MSNADMSAFPFNVTVHPEWNQEWQNGLTKREYLAAMAMQGLCANSVPGSHHGFKALTSEAVQYADALIDELNKPVQS